MKYIPYKSYINNALFLAVSNNAKKAIVTHFVPKMFNPSDAVKVPIQFSIVQMIVLLHPNQYYMINADNVKIQKLRTSKNKYSEKKKDNSSC